MKTKVRKHRRANSKGTKLSNKELASLMKEMRNEIETYYDDFLFDKIYNAEEYREGKRFIQRINLAIKQLE